MSELPDKPKPEPTSTSLQSAQLRLSENESESEILAWLKQELSITSLGKPASANTLDSYSRAVRRLLRFTQKGFDETTSTDYREYLRSRAQEVSQNSVASDDRILRAVFAKRSQTNRYLDSEEFKGFRRLKTTKQNKEKLSEEQAKRLLEIAEEKFSYRDSMVLRTMLMAGLRVSEIVEAKRSDFHHNSLHLVSTKGNKPRIVYLPEKLRDQLRDWLKVNDKEYLFADAKGHKANRRQLHSLVVRAGRRIGLRGLHPHILRRSYGSVAHARGAPLKFLQQQYGHSNIATTMEYIDIDAETSRKLANEYCEI